MLTRPIIAQVNAATNALWQNMLVIALVVTLFMLAVPAFAAQGEIVRISVSSAGSQASGTSLGPLVSGDGRYLVFTSNAPNLVAGDNNGRDDIFRFDRSTGAVAPVTVTQTGVFLQASHGSAGVSADGRFVAFWSDGVFDSTDDARSADVLLKDMSTGAVERVSVAADGSNKLGSDRVSQRLEISDDGRFVAFLSSATNLIAGDIEDDLADLFLRDRQSGTTILLSTEAAGGSGPSGGLEVVISGSGAAAVAGFGVRAPDRANNRLVIRVLESGAETVVEGVDAQRSSVLAVAPGGGKAIVGGDSDAPPVEYDVASKTSSALPENVDWREVDVHSFSTNLRYYVVAETDQFGFRVFDRETEISEDMPHAATGASPDQDVLPSSISDDGTIVGFSTAASYLVPGDTNGVSDSFYVRIGLGIFGDDDGNPFEADIEWLAEQGITLGCAFDLFCPTAPVTREQMASFLVRALDLPATTVDAFNDDDTSLHQADINALAAAGVTEGCGEELFCPTLPVSRQEMASFLVRALDLPAASVDYFSDDTGSVHEQDNNALALAQVTLGCGAGTFCPTGTVLREQMAAFLHRALS